METCLNGGVGGDNSGNQCTELTHGSRETVSRGTDRSGETFSGNQESNTVGTELVEERGQEVHGLESLDVLLGGVVFVVETGDNEENEAHQETDLLHPLTSVELVVDEERGEVVTT